MNQKVLRTLEYNKIVLLIYQYLKWQLWGYSPNCYYGTFRRESGTDFTFIYLLCNHLLGQKKDRFYCAKIGPM